MRNIRVFFPQESSDNLLAILWCSRGRRRWAETWSYQRRYVEWPLSLCLYTNKNLFLNSLEAVSSSSWHSKFECCFSHTRAREISINDDVKHSFFLDFFFIISSTSRASKILILLEWEWRRGGESGKVWTAHRKVTTSMGRDEKSRSLHWTAPSLWSERDYKDNLFGLSWISYRSILICVRI